MAATKVSIRVQPRARRNELVGLRDGVLVVRVTAPPLEGRANTAVCRLVAKRLGVPRSAVRVVVGEHARDKVIEVQGVDPDAALRSLTTDLSAGG